MSLMSGYFVAGTDTGVGKTLVSCILLREFVARGAAAVGMKPVASGCVATAAGWVSEDVSRLMAAGNVTAPREWINPYAFKPSVAPHIAARLAGASIRLPRIRAAFHKLRERADVVVVEGIGGFRVPLSERRDTADLARILGLPVILVVGMKLGCLNHALLTAEAIRGRGLRLAGWVANRIDPGMAEFEANVEALEERLNASLLGVIPHFSGSAPEHVAPALDWAKSLPVNNLALRHGQ